MKTTLHHLLSTIAYSGVLMTGTFSSIHAATYVNINAVIKVIPADGSGGLVAASLTNDLLGLIGGTTIEKDVATELQFKETISPWMNLAVYLTLAGAPNPGYTLASYYIDDGDGIFDPDKDTPQAVSSTIFSYIRLESDVFGTIYDSEEEAKQNFPQQPQITVFAVFTGGVQVQTAYFQDKLGTISISNPTNTIGDEVTVIAEPIEGYKFLFWDDDEDNIISRESSYTFTVSSPKTLYANFQAIHAPEFQFPEEGGYRVIYLNDDKGNWFLPKYSEAYCLLPYSEDIVDENGKLLLNTELIEGGRIDNAQNGNANPSRDFATIMWGKGRVRFGYQTMSGARQAELPFWSGETGKVFDTQGIPYVLYIFDEKLAAFVQSSISYGPISIPPLRAYLLLEPQEIGDAQGNIPVAIGLTADAFDKAADAFAQGWDGISQPQVNRTIVRGRQFYTLSGVPVSQPLSHGIHVVDGKKIIP